MYLLLQHHSLTTQIVLQMNQMSDFSV
jgi:hypothetical protein